MEFTEFTAEWKSLWPISSTFPSSIIQNKSPESPLGPLMFTANPNSSTTLLHSPSLSPRLSPPYPDLTLPRFLQNYCSVPPSFSSLLGPQVPDHSSHFHGFNSLQLLQIPNKNLIIVFFPTGENSDRVGFSLLSVKSGILSVHSQRENFFQLVKEGNTSRQRITQLLVNPVDDDDNGDKMFGDVRNADRRNNSVSVVGFLIVCTNYSVCWYRVGITSVYKQNDSSVCLDYLGCGDAKMFRGNAVANVCWSPHLREECLVLLENGDLFLFDVNSSCGGKKGSGNYRGVNKKIRVSLNEKLGLKEEEYDDEWFGCEFSWHPRIFIVSNRNEVFLVDLRSSGECNLCSLLKLESLSNGKIDGFLALSRAGPDGFSFTVATRHLLLLCDVRKPFMPVLRWSHGLQHPRYITVFKLSELRANAEDTKYTSASESGYGIMLGSFWESEFSLFCYGPHCERDGSVSSEISKFCNSCYAWGLPSEFSLSGSDCNCGSCLVRDEFTKESLPVWIDWRQKKNFFTLGFGILDPDLYEQLSRPESFGGFILIRLTSSGKIEAEQYHAVRESKKNTNICHKRKKSIESGGNLLYDCGNSEYDGVKKFQHLEFVFLNAFLNDKLARYIVRRREKRKESDEEDAQRKKYPVNSESNSHHEICQKLKAFGFPTVRSSLSVSDVLKDISLPTSIHEIASRSTFAALPTKLLRLAFTTYSDLDEDLENQNEPLEFLDIPDQIQVPPFPFRKPSQRSNKWSSKVGPPVTLVGPILPPIFLTTLHKVCIEELKNEKELYREETEEFSTHSQFKLQCDKVLEVVEEHISGYDAKTQEDDDDFVSLADDRDDMSSVNKKMKLSYHKPMAFSENPSKVEPGFSTHVFRRNQEPASDPSAAMVGPELFDDGCPIELKFDDCVFDCGPKELELYRNLKKRDLDFQKSFKPYQDFISKGK